MSNYETFCDVSVKIIELYKVVLRVYVDLVLRKGGSLEG